MADRIAHPCRVGILWKLSTISPDLTVGISPLEVLKDALGRLNEFHGVDRNLEKKITWHPDRIARHHRIISEATCNGTRAVHRLRGVESRFTPRRHGRSFIAHRQNSIRPGPGSGEVLRIERCLTIRRES